MMRETLLFMERSCRDYLEAGGDVGNCIRDSLRPGVRKQEIFSADNDCSNEHLQTLCGARNREKSLAHNRSTGAAKTPKVALWNFDFRRVI